MIYPYLFRRRKYSYYGSPTTKPNNKQVVVWTGAITAIVVVASVVAMFLVK